MSERLTPAEKQRAYRQRQKAKAAEAKQARGYSWPPFEEGNTAAVVHGGSSPGRVDPLGAQLMAELLECDPAPHLREPRFRFTLEAWARATAQCVLIGAWVAERVAEGGLESALSEVTSSEETSAHKGGRGRKVSTGRRVEAALSALDRAERRAAQLRSDLLITPAAAHRARLEVGQKPFSLMSYWMDKDREKETSGD